MVYRTAGTSCESWLKEEVKSGVSYDYLETKTGMETAVNGVYSTMRWYVGGERYYSLTEYGVDYVWEGADGGNKDALHLSACCMIFGRMPIKESTGPIRL